MGASSTKSRELGEPEVHHSMLSRPHKYQQQEKEEEAPAQAETDLPEKPKQGKGQTRAFQAQQTGPIGCKGRSAFPLHIPEDVLNDIRAQILTAF